MYEYVLTAGEGILISFGVCSWEHVQDFIGYDWLELGQEFIIRPCDDDCETGQ